MARHSCECTTAAMLSRLEAWESEGRLPGVVDPDARLGVSPEGHIVRLSYANPFIQN